MRPTTVRITRNMITAVIPTGALVHTMAVRLQWAECNTAVITADTISHMNGAVGTRAAAAFRMPQLEAVVADADGSLLTGQKTRFRRPRPR